VGCGAGYWLRAFLEFDARPEDLVGIDVSDARFELARAKNPRGNARCFDVPAIPFVQSIPQEDRGNFFTDFERVARL
jgi:SAM-dependent methyltransferase